MEEQKIEDEKPPTASEQLTPKKGSREARDHRVWVKQNFPAALEEA